MDHQSKSTRGKSDHWDILASTLGATPSPESDKPAAEPSPPEQFAEQPDGPQASFPSVGSLDFVGEPAAGPADLVGVPEPGAPPAAEPVAAVSQEIVSESADEARPSDTQDVLPSLPPSTFVPPRPDRQKTPQDWARLASQLGVELPPEPFEPVEATAATTLEPSPRPSIVVTTLETGAWPSGDKSAAGPNAEKPATGRRRGERRRKHRSAATSAFGASLHEPKIEDSGAAEAGAAYDDLDDLLVAPEEPEAGPELAEELAAETADSSAAADAQAGAPPRAKRRRRRKKKPPVRAPETPEAALAQARERVESIEDRAFDADAHLLESADSDLPHDAEQADTEEADDEKGGIHRSIPTWEEAVGFLIAANLEARAKNPERRLPYSPRGRNR